MVKVNNFVFKAEPHDQIEQGNFGAGKFQREMLELTKLEKVTISAATVKDRNPLSEVSVLLDY